MALDALDTRIEDHGAFQLRRSDRRLLLNEPRIEVARREIPPEYSGQRRPRRLENMGKGQQLFMDPK